MERLSQGIGERRGPLEAERKQLCLHCGHPASDRPRGCKSGHCRNCGHPYPLGDCSD